jgi:hypothetical protein
MLSSAVIAKRPDIHHFVMHAGRSIDELKTRIQGINTQNQLQHDTRIASIRQLQPKHKGGKTRQSIQPDPGIIT